MNIKSKSNLRCRSNQKTLVFVSLLFMVTLVSSCFAPSFNSTSLFALGTSDKVVVKNEAELRNAINNAPSKSSITIALDNDISLSSALTIPTNTDITLTSSKIIGFYKLIGASGMNTITVEDNGVLKIDGVIVTHSTKGLYEGGGGVIVDVNGKFILYSGEISDNSGVLFAAGTLPGGGIWSQGGGVLNHGVFEMYGGKISNNESPQGYGGGVFNNGSFTMSGGEISNNAARYSGTGNGSHGGGVENRDNFVMSGGKITNNIASGYAYESSQGGGVRNLGSFTMSGGEISNNEATYGGGVCNSKGGTFDKLGGVVSGNTATNKNGVGNDIYTYSSGGSSDGGNSGGSSNGNNGLTGGNSGGGSSNGNNVSTAGNGYGLRDVVIICVGVVGVVGVGLSFYFRRKMKQVEDKLNRHIEG
jgi:hypothetical protein